MPSLPAYSPLPHRKQLSSAVLLGQLGFVCGPENVVITSESEAAGHGDAHV